MPPSSSPRPAAPASAPPAARSGAGGSARWLLALAAPVVPFAILILSQGRVTPEVQRLALLAVVAVVGVGLGSGPAILSAIVATLVGWYSPEAGRWVVDLVADQVALIAFAATAVVVALTAGARRGASVEARLLRAHLAAAERDEAASQETIARLTAERTALRAEANRTAADLAESRATADRLGRSRKAILDGLPPELRAPHVVPPAALQLFPPLLTPAPLGVAAPSLPARPDETAAGDAFVPEPPRAEWE